MRARLAIESLLNRRWTLCFTLVSLVVSVMLVLGINHVRSEVKEGFRNTLSGTDLIVGARGGSINLLLYSVFHMGSATHNIKWNTYEELTKHSQVDWLIPLALGDSHKGHKVIATNESFFNHYAYAQNTPLKFTEGKEFVQPLDVVLGAAVAKELKYKVGDKIVLAHGVAEVSLAKHDDAPFIVSGILAATGTPVDKGLYISLAGMELIHRDWHSGMRIPSSHDHDHHEDDQSEHQHNESVADSSHPQTLSAILVGLKNRSATFTVQRQINQYAPEPLQAIMPGLALTELWTLMATAEIAFNFIAWFVVVASLLGVMTALLTALNERQREFAILRSLGAGYVYIFTLISMEILLLCVLAVVLAVGLLAIAIVALQPWIISTWGIYLSANIFTSQQLYYIFVVLMVAFVMSIVPAWIACRRSLSGGLSVRI